MPAWLQRDWCSSFVLGLGHFLWQGTLIAIMLAIALRAVKTVSVRYWLSLAALLLMAASPVATLGWLLRPVSHVATLDAQPVVREEVEPIPQVVAETQVADATSFPDELPQAELNDVRLREPVAIPVPQSALVNERSWWQRFAPQLTTAYLTGVTLMFLRLAIGLWGGRRLRRRTAPVTDTSLLTALQRQAEALGMKLRPALAYCERVAVPTVVGVLKPMILLPLTLTSGLSPEQMESVLAHELAHLRRYDHLVNLLQRVIESLLFFHPAMWWVSHRIRDEREHCCDDLVVACGALPLDYAKSLLVVAELSRASPLRRSVAAVSLLATGNQKPSNLRQRIARLLGESATPSLRVSTRALLLAIGIPLVALIVTIQSGAGRGSSDPALDPTAGLPKSDEETNQPNNANGDLRSNPAAGSEDPRRAQHTTEEQTKSKSATQLADIIQRLMKEEQKYNRIEVIVRSHQQPLKVLNHETQEIEIVRRLIRDHDLSYYLEESFCRIQETGATSLIVHEETIQGRWWRQRIESNGPGAAKHSNDSLFVLPKSNHRLGPHTLALGYWLDRPESLSDILTDETPGRRKIIELLGEETIGKERCVKLKDHDVSAGGSKSYRLIWLALDKNLLPVRSERCDKTVERTQPLGFTQVTEWLEVQAGIWFPKRIEVHQTQKTANGIGNLESIRTHTLTVELVTLQPQIKPSLFDKLGKPPSTKPSQNAKAKIEQGFTEAEARDTQAAAKTAPPEGLAFLKPYPKLHGLSLDMTELQFLEIVKQQELKTRKTVDGEKVTHHIALGDNHTLIVMFDKDGKCSGIQRVRGEDTPRAGRGSLNHDSAEGLPNETPPPSNQPSPKNKVRDEQPDPLPLGAIQRFGTEQFRVPVPGLYKSVDFSADARLIFVNADNRLTVLDRETGRRNKNARLNPGPGNDWVWKMAVSPDGKFVAVAMSNILRKAEPQNYRIVILNPATTRRLLLPLDDRPIVVNFLSFSADNKTLVAGGEVSGLRFWNLETGEDIAKPTFAELQIGAAAFSPDGQRLVMIGNKKSLIWKWQTNDAPRDFDSKFGDRALTVKFSPDGKWFAVGYGTFNGLRVFNAATGEFAWQIDTQGKWMNPDGGIAFTRDSQFVAVPVEEANAVELWNIQTRTRVHSFECTRPRTVAISRDDRWLIAGGRNSRVDLWNLATRESVADVSEGHDWGITKLRFSPDGQALASAGDEGTVRLWEVATGKQTHKLHHDLGRMVRGLAFSPDGRLVVSSAFDKTLGLWDSSTGQRLRTVPGHGQYGGSRAVQFSSDGNRFASWGDYDLRLNLWNTSDGKLLATHTTKIPDAVPPDQNPNGPGVFANGLFSSDASILLIEFAGKLFEFETGNEQPRRPIPTDQKVIGFTLSPDGKWLATVEQAAGNDRTKHRLILRNLATLEVRHQFEDVRPWSNQTIAFSPDSRRLACNCGYDSPRIDIVDVQSGKLSAQIADAPQCTSLQFSPDGKYLASAHVNTTILLWDLAKVGVKEEMSSTIKRFPTVKDLSVIVGHRALPGR